jgi:hypothetical protein
MVFLHLPDYRGYLLIHFDVLLNFWNLYELNLDRFWHIYPNDIIPLNQDEYNAWGHWMMEPHGAKVVREMWNELDEKHKKYYAKSTVQTYPLKEDVSFYIVFADIACIFTLNETCKAYAC